MTLVVTGAASFVGGVLVQQARKDGLHVVGFDLVEDRAAGINAGDIRDPGFADLLPATTDVVVHLAAIARDADCRADPVACFDVNVTGTVNLAYAAHRQGAKQIIFASSEWIYDYADAAEPRREEEPIDPHRLSSEYSLSKLMGEVALRQVHDQTGIAVTVLRFGIIYGPRRNNWSAVEALLDKVATTGKVEVGSARTARGFVHVVDVADAVLASRGRAGFEIFNIQSPVPVTLGQVVETASNILGRPTDLVETAADCPSVRNISGERARTHLGWSPAIDLRTGLTSVARFLGHLPQPNAAFPGEEQ